MTTDESGKQYVYDGWGHIVVVKNSGGKTLETFVYDGRGYRIQQAVGATTTQLLYSSGWQVLEEQVAGATKARYVWSPTYVNALVFRDRDVDGNSANGLEERLYAIYDANYNVTALTSGITVVERFYYDSFGERTVLTPSWVVAAGSAYSWVINFQGMRLDTVSGLTEAQRRWLSTTLGRWVTNDPILYQAGDNNLYRFVGNGPVGRLDPSGLQTRRIWICTTKRDDTANSLAYTWHRCCATAESLNSWNPLVFSWKWSSDHTIAVDQVGNGFNIAVSKMEDRNLLREGDKISFLEFVSHGGDHGAVLPISDLMTDQEIRDYVLKGNPEDSDGKKLDPSKFEARIKHDIEQAKVTRASIQKIKQCLTDDAEIRIAACCVGGDEERLKLMARAFGAKIVANDGWVAVCGEGKWKVADKTGETVVDDMRWGNCPGIGRFMKEQVTKSRNK